MNKTVVITGSAAGIGRALREAYETQGFTVYGIDVAEGEAYQGDVGSKEDLTEFIAHIRRHSNRVDVLIHNSPPPSIGIDAGTYEEFNRAMAIGVTAAYYLIQELRDLFSEGSSILFLTSTRAEMSQRQTESYSAAKGALAALTHTLAMSLGPMIRVNGIAPGWIETSDTQYPLDGPDCRQHPVGRVGNVQDIVEAALYLTSDRASFITGQILTVDGGMTRRMIYHGDEGWSLT